MSMKPPPATLVAVLTLIAVAARAHDVDGPNGGRITDAGNYHAELVIADKRVAVFLTDGNDKPVAARGHAGLAIMTVGGKSERIALQPDGGKLSGTATVALPKNVKGVVRITAPDGKVSQGQYK
jgi:hypothetical protein